MTVAPDQLTIVHHPHPVLHRKADPLESVNDEVRAVAQRMLELMHEAQGIGLAAPQVALPWRMFVAFVPPSDDPEHELSADLVPPTAWPEPLVCINPVIEATSRDLVPFEEGCLSLPEIRGDVRRPSVVTMRALDANGESFTLEAGGLLGRCIQHEFDHLEGVLILSKFGRLDRLKNRSQVRSLEAEGA